MSVARMRRVALYGRLRDREELLRLLQNEAAIDPDPAPEQGETAAGELEQAMAAAARDGAAAERFLAFLDRHHPQKPNLVEQFAGIKTILTEREFTSLTGERTALNRLTSEMAEIEAALASIGSRRQESKNRVAALAPWRDLALTQAELAGTAHVRFILAAVEARLAAETLAELTAADERAAALKVGQDASRVYLLLILPRAEKPETAGILAGPNLVQAALPPFAGTVAQALSEEECVQAELEKEEEAVRDRLAGLAGERTRAQAIFDHILSERRRLEAARNALQGKRSFALTGWAPSHRLEALRAALTRSGLPYHLEVREPEEGEVPPVELRNTAAVTPFEALVQSFNYPQYQEIDPTPSITPFFLIFFGFCLGDAGYGLALSLFCLVLLWRLKMKPMGKKLAKVFALGGAAAIVMGFVTQSVFGFTVKLPFPFHINPMTQAIALLLAALGLGTVQAFFGTVLSALPALRERRYGDALFGQGAWLLFLSLVMLNVGKDAIGLGAYGRILSYLLFASVALVVVGAMRGRKGILGKLLGIPAGLFTIYGSIGYFSDILSYSRLMALGLSGGVMASIINLFAGMAWKGGYGIGQLGGVAIFLFGHALNLALGILGAYVHSSRLQYLEFFGKFFEGGGRPFTPLAYEHKYTFLVKQKEA